MHFRKKGGKGRERTRPVCVPSVHLQCTPLHMATRLKPSFVLRHRSVSCGRPRLSRRTAILWLGFSLQQSSRDGMCRLAALALSASLQDTVGRPWHGQTNHVFGLVMFRPLLHPDPGTCWFDLLQRSARLSQALTICSPGQGIAPRTLVCDVVSRLRTPPAQGKVSSVLSWACDLIFSTPFGRSHQQVEARSGRQGLLKILKGLRRLDS